MQRICVIGAGAWGTALAAVARRAGRNVVLHAHEAETVAAINTDHENTGFLPGITLDLAITATDDLSAAAEGADAILMVTPAQFLRPTLTALAPPETTPVVICSKGIELDSGKLMNEVAGEAAPGRTFAVLSGPTFAAEVARGLPTAVTLASEDADVAAALATALGTPSFRPYTAGDVIGAEVGGAIKNVIAIACGIVDGRRLGQNARAAVIARGLAEIARFAATLGADPRTLMGLSGLGDLTLTCTSVASRNYSLGEALGRGETLEQVMSGRRSVAEGVTTAPAVLTRAAALGVEMPICAAVSAILHDGAGVDATIAEVLARPLRTED
ncbi:MAG: glycerol-3-phosphate acyltransferase [Alphaproteobacteria bacterium]|nr:glycerol-3-phosphate acyltransferase [Alphaproteobacteria bacterium]|tara:strand:- start:1872 stop:2858 length:987 start_codon:yes stop_codon:yes gene_type:complete